MRACRSRSRSPGRQARSVVSSARAASTASAARRSCSAGLRARRRPASASPASTPKPACPSLASVAAGLPANSRAAAIEALRRPRTTRPSPARRPRPARSCSAAIRGALDVRGQSERVAGRDDDPHRARGRARLDAILESGGEPGDRARCRQDDRGCAEIGEQRTHLRELRSDLCVGRAFGSSERRDDDRERCHVHRPLSTRRCSAEQNAIW